MIRPSRGWKALRRSLTVLAGLCLGDTAHAQQGAKPPLVFTAIPDQDTRRLVERSNKVTRYLEEKLGVEVRYIPVNTFMAAATAFANGQVQLAWLGGLTGVQARKAVAGSLALAQGAEDAAYKTYFIARTGLGLEKSTDFPIQTAGRSFVFGPQGTTSGWLMPEYFIRQAFPGKSPDEIYSRVGFSSSHSGTIALVQSSLVDVGAVDHTVWDQESKTGKVNASAVRVIWESPPFPNRQWTVRGDVDVIWGEGFTEKLRKVILNIKDPNILELFGRSKFIAATNEAYAPIIEAGKATGLFQ